MEHGNITLKNIFVIWVAVTANAYPGTSSCSRASCQKWQSSDGDLDSKFGYSLTSVVSLNLYILWRDWEVEAELKCFGDSEEAKLFRDKFQMFLQDTVYLSKSLRQQCWDEGSLEEGNNGFVSPCGYYKSLMDA